MYTVSFNVLFDLDLITVKTVLFFTYLCMGCI